MQSIENSINENLTEVKETINRMEEKIKNVFQSNIDKINKYEKVDETINELRKLADNEEVVVKLSIGGEKYHVTLDVLLSLRDSFFHGLISQYLRNNISFRDQEIFIDRDPKYFPIILDFLYTQNNSTLERLSEKELAEAREELEFYGLTEAFNHVKVEKKEKDYEVKLKSVEASPQFMNIGHRDVEFLREHRDKSGISVMSPFMITFELEKECVIDKIEIAAIIGYNLSELNPKNGVKAEIAVSCDKIYWSVVAKIPKNFGGNIISFSVKQMNAKYIRFKGKNNWGIGYLKLFEKKK